MNTDGHRYGGRIEGIGITKIPERGCVRRISRSGYGVVCGVQIFQTARTISRAAADASHKNQNYRNDEPLCGFAAVEFICVYLWFPFLEFQLPDLD